MKKAILILVLLTLAVVIVGLPAAIGWFVHDRLSETVSEELPDAEVEWDRGWFRSGLRVEDEAFGARLDFRHASPGAGWISVDGLVSLAEWAAAIDLDARLALDGTLSANASTPTLEVPGPVTWRYQAPDLALTAKRGGDAELSGAAERLLIVDGIGNRFAFVEPAVEVRMESESLRTSSARIALTASRVGEAESRLAVEIESIDDAALAELLQALGQLAGAEPDSAAAGFGAIGAASAWQQLVSAGLRIEIVEFVLDGELSLSGHWQPEEKDFVLTGQGRRETLLQWWSSIAGLAGQLPPEQARAAARMGLQDLADRGAIELDGDRINVDLQALPQSTSAQD